MNRLIRRDAICSHAYFRINGRFIGAIDSREILDLAAPRFGIEAFDIAFFANRERRINEDFEKLTFRKKAPRQRSVIFKRRNERHKYDEARIHHELGHFGHAADIFNPICFGKAKIFVEAMTNIIAI